MENTAQWKTYGHCELECTACGRIERIDHATKRDGFIATHRYCHFCGAEMKRDIPAILRYYAGKAETAESFGWKKDLKKIVREVVEALSCKCEEENE